MSVKTIMYLSRKRLLLIEMKMLKRGKKYKKKKKLKCLQSVYVFGGVMKKCLERQDLNICLAELRMKWVIRVGWDCGWARYGQRPLCSRPTTVLEQGSRGPVFQRD